MTFCRFQVGIWLTTIQPTTVVIPRGDTNVVLRFDLVSNINRVDSRFCFMNTQLYLGQRHKKVVHFSSNFNSRTSKWQLIVNDFRRKFTAVKTRINFYLKLDHKWTRIQNCQRVNKISMENNVSYRCLAVKTKPIFKTLS